MQTCQIEFVHKSLVEHFQSDPGRQSVLGQRDRCHAGLMRFDFRPAVAAVIGVSKRGDHICVLRQRNVGDRIILTFAFFGSPAFANLLGAQSIQPRHGDRNQQAKESQVTQGGFRTEAALTRVRASLLKISCRVGQARFERRPTICNCGIKWWAGVAKRLWYHPTPI